MHPILESIRRVGIIPVIKLDDSKHALPLARALTAGGLPAAEITFRTAAAESSIRAMTKAFPDLLIGAGTVLTCQQVDAALQAGAKFIVSPGTNPQVVRYCLQLRVPILPGVVTPTEIESALELGLNTLKFFPAEPSGGLTMIEALAAPYPLSTSRRLSPTPGLGSPHLLFPKLLHSRDLSCASPFYIRIRSLNTFILVVLFISTMCKLTAQITARKNRFQIFLEFAFKVGTLPFFL